MNMSQTQNQSPPKNAVTIIKLTMGYVLNHADKQYAFRSLAEVFEYVGNIEEMQVR